MAPADGAVVAEVRGAWKWYARAGRLSRLRRGRATAAAGEEPTPPDGATVALADVDLAVAPGQAVGVVGPNGSGKTTLLRLLAGITTPSAGRVRRRGRVTSLIELGIGFHPDLTGRENVAYTAALLGMGATELAARWDAIVEVSGIAHAVDVPVRQWSSGMVARMGFAVATEVPADLVVVDEVLAVGDLDFQVRSLQRLRQLNAAGVATVLVSHDLATVASLCTHAVRLDHGRVVAAGDPDEVIGGYSRQVPAGSGAGPAPARIVQLDVTPRRVDPGGTVEVAVRLDVEHPDPDAEVRLRLALGPSSRAWLSDLPVGGVDLGRISDDPLPIDLGRPGPCTARGTVGPLVVPPGDYTLSVVVLDGGGAERTRADATVDVSGRISPTAQVRLPAHWQVDGPDGGPPVGGPDR